MMSSNPIFPKNPLPELPSGIALRGGRYSSSSLPVHSLACYEFLIIEVSINFRPNSFSCTGAPADSR